MSTGFFESRMERNGTTRRKAAAKRSKADALPNYEVYRERGCEGCPLNTKALHHPQMPPSGAKHPTVYILGEAPGREEDDKGVQFVGRSGKLLRGVIAKEFGDDYADSFRFNNCVCCRPIEEHGKKGTTWGAGNRTPARHEWERCYPRVSADIERAKPDVLVAVGAVALQWATGETAITKWRGKFVPVKVGNHTCWLYPILHPSFVMRSEDWGDSDWSNVFRLDLRRLRSRLALGLGEVCLETPETIERGVCYARDVQGLVKLGRQLTLWGDAKEVVAFDIETACLRPYQYLPSSNGWLSIAFSDGETTWAVPFSHKEAGWVPEEYQQVKDLVQRFLRSKCIKVAHSLPFELEWMTQVYGHKPSWIRKRWGDTMIQAYCLDERRGTLGLDHLCQYRFGLRLKAQSDVDRAKLANQPIDQLLRYNALDAKYTAKLYHVQKQEIVDEGLMPIYREHVKRCMTLVKAQQRGLVVDFPLVARYQRRLAKKIDRCMAAIMESREAKKYKKQMGKPLSPTSSIQVAKLFRDILKRPEGVTKRNKSGYSVDDEVLQKMDLEVADNILELRKHSKTKSTYIDPCMPVGGVIYADGRIHTKYNDLFTVTGRLSSEDPNVQNFPKREDDWVRKIVICPQVHPITGQSCKHVMVSCDYGQIEPRVIAMASGDKRLCQALWDRYDIHLDWAERIAAADTKLYKSLGSNIKKLRQEVKSNWVLAGFYGAQYDGIAARLHLTKNCHDLFESFKEEFAGVWRWQRRQLKAYARDGYVSCLTGRRRHAPLSMNQLLNNTTQGTASDIVIDAMNRLSVRAEKENEPAFQAVLNIHDDLTFYVPEEQQEELTAEIVKEMLTPTFEWINVPMAVEVKAGTNWAELHDVGTYFSDELP